MRVLQFAVAEVHPTHGAIFSRRTIDVAKLRAQAMPVGDVLEHELKAQEAEVDRRIRVLDGQTPVLQ